MRTTEGIAFFIALYVLVVVVQTVFVIMFTRRSMRIEMLLGRDMKRACFIPVSYTHLKLNKEKKQI